MNTASARLLCCALLACAGTAAAARAPAIAQDAPVGELRMNIRGAPVVLHATKSGFLPEQTDRMRFDAAGPLVYKATGSRPPRYRWAFKITLLGASKPARIRIEQVAEDADVLLLDDNAPAVQGDAWIGKAPSECDILPGSPCGAWFFAEDVQPFIFRATVTFDDGTTQVLNQGTLFRPEKVRALTGESR